MSPSDAFFQQTKIKSAPVFCCHILNLIALFSLIVPAMVLYPYAIRKRRVVCSVTKVVAPEEAMRALPLHTPRCALHSHSLQAFSSNFRLFLASQNNHSTVFCPQYPVYVEVEWDDTLYNKGQGNLLRCVSSMKHKSQMLQCFKRIQKEFPVGKKMDCAVPSPPRRRVLPWKQAPQQHHQHVTVSSHHASTSNYVPPTESSYSETWSSDPKYVLPRSHPQVHEYHEWMDARKATSLSLLKMAGIFAGVSICVDIIFLVACFGGELVKTYVFRRLGWDCRYLSGKKRPSIDQVAQQMWNNSHYKLQYDNSDACTYKIRHNPSKWLLCDESNPKIKLNRQARHLLANTAPSMSERVLHEHRVQLYDALKTSGSYRVWWRMAVTIIFLLCVLFGGIGMIVYLAVYYELWSIGFVIPVCVVLSLIIFTYFVDICIIPYSGTVIWVTNNHRVIVHSEGMLHIFNLDAIEHTYTRDELVHYPPEILKHLPRKYYAESIVCRTSNGDDVIVCTGVRGVAEWIRLYQAIRAQCQIARYYRH